jgi:glycosyltransferase involved in cell wall biosynthesis
VIDTRHPDFTDTPACASRPSYPYQPATTNSPLVSIVTPYYNAGPEFQQTIESLQHQSFTTWEWIVVDDGSTDPDSLAQLEHLISQEPRACVIHQSNAGPAVARNTAVQHARGTYIMQLDADDLVEPTFLEKALWVLATQPQFAACNSYTVTFGARNLLWPYGFQDYSANISDNKITNMSVISRDAWLKVGGYDPSISYEHADWDFWLTLAHAGMWGYTIPEYLSWYRAQQHSLLGEIEGDLRRAQKFRDWLHNKHHGLRQQFPHPYKDDSPPQNTEEIPSDLPFMQKLVKPEKARRILIIVPWFEMGGADQFNFDLVQTWCKRGYDVTLVATLSSHHAWLHRFAQLTPDIFCLPTFLAHRDFPRFLRYLIESRNIDTLLVSNSEFGYGIVPYLRFYFPDLSILDFCHSEVEDWQGGGYPGISLRTSGIDLRITCTQYLRNWMIKRGANAERILTCYCGINTEQWNIEKLDRHAIRQEIDVPEDKPVILFIGRIAEEKRPMLFVQIMQRLVSRVPNALALVIGDGPELPHLRTFVRRHHLDHNIRFLGSLPHERIQSIMAAGDLLLLTSAYEGLPLVLYEALTMKLVPIAAQVGGIAELIDESSGILIEHGDNEINDYLAALIALINDPERRRQMGECGYQRVMENFSLVAMGETMEHALLISDQTPRQTEINKKSGIEASLTAVTRTYQINASEWATDNGPRPLVLLRKARRKLLPNGTSQFELYKRTRASIQRAIHITLNLPRYMYTGKIRQVPLRIQIMLESRFRRNNADYHR